LPKLGHNLFRGALIACVLVDCQPGALAKDDVISVQLFEAHRPVRQVQIRPPFEIVQSGTVSLVTRPVRLEAEQGQLYIRNANKKRRPLNPPFFIRGSGRQPVTLVVPPVAPRSYRGDILIGLSRGESLQIINRVHLRDYINDVVASEMPPKTPSEALKAQAVLVQTALTHREQLSELGDSTEHQCYLGATAERPEVTSSVSSVWGKILCYQGTPVVAYYHSTCAGGTSAAAEYFGLDPGSLPYLKAVGCANCRHSPFWKPTRKEIPMAIFAQVFGDGVPTILKRDAAGRPLSVKLANGRLLTGYKFWIELGKSFGWDKAPGTRYSLVKGLSDKIVIESTGAGHGVGFCQWGANGLAETGKSYEEILQYYYPGCQVCGRH
jgi:stage II sporulation protein D